jgi:hypothetical protein
MIARRLLFAVFLGFSVGTAQAVDLKARTVSSSKEFFIYSPDARLRGQVAGFAEEIKTQLLVLLGETGRARSPILITLERNETFGAAGAQLHAFEGPDGSTIQLDVRLDEETPVDLQKYILRADLLELVYRDRGGIKGGEAYVEAPWWVIEGAAQIIRRRDLGVESDLFKRLIEQNKFPPLAQFLSMRDGSVGATAAAIDEACAMCLVQLLVEQPNGRANLGRFLRHWADNYQDPVGALLRDFPALAEKAGQLEKWWTLNLARFSAAERHQGLSAEETEKELANLLSFEVAVNAKGEKQRFSIGDYRDFLKLPGSKAVVTELHGALIGLSVRANPLFRGVVADYESITAALLRRKTRGLAVRLADAERYRKALLERMSAVADYLNWFEATQFGTRSDAFDGFLKAARQLSLEEKERAHSDDPVAKYLDSLQEAF